MSIDDAIRKVSFLPQKGAKILKDVGGYVKSNFIPQLIESCLLSIESLPLPFCWQCLLEGQKIAVREHGIEYPSNMWIGMFQFYVCCRCKMALALNIISE